MEEWKEYKLGEIAQIQTGPFGSQLHKSDYVDDGVPCIMPTNIGKNLDVISDGIAHISENDAQRLSRHLVTAGDIIYARRGDIEKCAYIQEQQNGWFCGTGCLRIRINKDADSHFIAYQLSTSEAKSWIVGNAVGTTMLNLNSSILSDLPVLLPSLFTQRHITAILKSLDDKIECNRRINENLEQQAQALFKSWFVDFEPFKDQPFVESELGMIPQGWKVGCLDDLCSFISRGLTPKYDETSDELILGQTCVRNNIVTLNNARKHRPKSKTEKWVQQWDILLNSTGIGSLGRVGVVYFNMDNVAIDSHITVVRTSKSLYRHYVGRNLLSRQLEIENMAVGSTGQTELPRDRVKTMTIIVPSDDALTKFNYIIEPMALTMYRNIEENKRLAELRDTLLPRLMSGELKVNDVDA